MARIYLHGQLGGGTKWAEAMPYVSKLFDYIENVLNGNLDDTNITAKSITAASLADLTVTGAKIASGTITTDKLVDGVGVTTSGNYTGDGTTVSRTITFGFTPRSVQVIRTDATFIEFWAIQDGGTTTNWYRDAAGAVGALTTNWAGIITNGFQLGTTAAGTANVAAVVYRYVAFK